VWCVCVCVRERERGGVEEVGIEGGRKGLVWFFE
jgi:hypothetical protein